MDKKSHAFNYTLGEIQLLTYAWNLLFKLVFNLNFKLFSTLKERNKESTNGGKHMGFTLAVSY